MLESGRLCDISVSAGVDMPVTNVSEFWMPQKRLRGGFEPTDLWVMSRSNFR